MYSANSPDLDALRWAAKDKGGTVISQSFHRSSEPGSASMSYDDIYKDWLALQWPYPTICQAAGNCWRGDDDTATAIAGDSVFRNPSSAHML